MDEHMNINRLFRQFQSINYIIQANEQFTCLKIEFRKFKMKTYWIAIITSSCFAIAILR